MGSYAEGAVVTFGMQFAGFVVAAILQTEVFYDVLGGINFLTLAVLSQIAGSRSSAESTGNVFGKNAVFAVLFAISRGWLLVFLAWRAHQRKGDARFDGVRDKPVTFFKFWMVQAVWVYCISLPLLVVTASETAASNSETGLSTFDASSVMLLFMALSIVVEIWSDVAKTAWVVRGRHGDFCTDGPWRYSRHPNYAGEILMWIFAAVYAVLVSGGAWYSIVVASISPLFTMQILLNTAATGVWNAEGKNLKRYYEDAPPTTTERYEQYRKTTPPIFPILLVPYERIPRSIQRIFCFEWERYEYRPSLKNKNGKTE